MGAVLLMMVFDLSVNVITTFSLLLVTGIIVDDAVIIVENVQRHLEMGKDRVQAAIDGTKRSVWSRHGEHFDDVFGVRTFVDA